jgi:hypothetical protein
LDNDVLINYEDKRKLIKASRKGNPELFQVLPNRGPKSIVFNDFSKSSLLEAK